MIHDKISLRKKGTEILREESPFFSRTIIREFVSRRPLMGLQEIYYLRICLTM